MLTAILLHLENFTIWGGLIANFILSTYAYSHISESNQLYQSCNPF